MSSIHDAIEAGSLHCVQEIIQRDSRELAALDDLKNTLLHTAVDQEQLEIVDLLLRAGADVNARGQEGEAPLHRAVRGDDPDIVERLIAHGANLEAKNNLGWTPLHWAVRANAEMADQLLQHGAHLDLDSAIQLGRADQVRKLLDQDPGALKAVSRPDSLLEGAVVAGSVEIINLLIERGLSVNVKDGAARSPLLTAVEQALPGRDLSIVQLLLERGANPNIRDALGESLLNVAKKYAQPGEAANAADVRWSQQVQEILVKFGAR